MNFKKNKILPAIVILIFLVAVIWFLTRPILVDDFSRWNDADVLARDKLLSAINQPSNLVQSFNVDFKDNKLTLQNLEKIYPGHPPVCIKEIQNGKNDLLVICESTKEDLDKAIKMWDLESQYLVNIENCLFSPPEGESYCILIALK